MLAALSIVDMVIVFPEDTPLSAIEALRPHVLVKGSDYTETEVIGGDFVRAAGGHVALAPLEPGFSTTAILASRGSHS
jgi:D-beta-D-heptose 7-phosphate kinase/D-beta-D-heptose 1-phosphate adenosyltransferase